MYRRRKRGTFVVVFIIPAIAFGLHACDALSIKSITDSE